MIKLAIDGGYLSWAYGGIGSKSWPLVHYHYSKASGALICLDSPESARRLFYAEYKLHRKLRREEDPRKEEMHQRIKFFQEIIREDHSLLKLEVPGLEADDLVSILSLRYNLPVIGGDKDLLQVPDLYLQTLEKEVLPISKFAKRQPKAYQEFVVEPKDVLLVLALMGDKSDDIPRLSPPRS